MQAARSGSSGMTRRKHPTAHDLAVGPQV